MFFKKFSCLFVCIFLCNFNFKIESRELSIKQLEDRKLQDLEREKQRDNRGSKKFSKEINLTTEIIFFSKERKVPAVLSNLDPI